jgi:hypothetical protein
MGYIIIKKNYIIHIFSKQNTTVLRVKLQFRSRPAGPKCECESASEDGKAED